MAERFAAEGMNLALADVEASALTRVEARLKASDAQVIARQTDVSRSDELEALKAYAVDAYGAVHLLCNNAGVGMGGVLWEHTVLDWEWLLGVNVLGVANGLRAFVPQMLAQGDGCHIVNTASAAGLDARPYLGMYSASKYAVVAISEALQQELMLRGAKIGVSVLCPALVNTQIGDSERNRPLALRNRAEQHLPADAVAFDNAFRTALAQGSAPASIADSVVEAIRGNVFYVLPQEETEIRVRARLERIIADRARGASICA
jgi:short-subunit dehydrogenase